MQYHSSDSQGLLLAIYGETKEALGRIEQKVDGQTVASEARHQVLHKRIDKVEALVEHHRRTSPSSTKLFETLTGTLRVLQALYAHWPHIMWVLALVLGFFGIKNPELLKGLIAKP